MSLVHNSTDYKSKFAYDFCSTFDLQEIKLIVMVLVHGNAHTRHKHLINLIG